MKIYILFEDKTERMIRGVFANQKDPECIKEMFSHMGLFIEEYDVLRLNDNVPIKREFTIQDIQAPYKQECDHDFDYSQMLASNPPKFRCKKCQECVTWKKLDISMTHPPTE